MNAKVHCPHGIWYLWVGIQFLRTDLNFWTQIPIVLYLKTTWLSRRELIVSRLAITRTKTLKMHLKGSKF